MDFLILLGKILPLALAGFIVGTLAGEILRTLLF